MTLLLMLAVVSLPVMVVLARLVDERRQRELEERASTLLSPGARGALRTVELQLGDLAVGVEVGTVALRARDTQLLRAAVVAVDCHAPSLGDGLRALSAMARTVAVLVPPPPVRPSAWRAQRLRLLTAAVLAAHTLAVTGAERVRLRLWLLVRALRFAAHTLRRGANRVHTSRSCSAWQEVARSLEDLGRVGTEAGLTYDRVVRALDALGQFVPAA